MVESAIGLVLAPLASFILISFVTRRAKVLSAVISIAAAGISFALALSLLVGLLSAPAGAGLSAEVHASIQWLSIPSIGHFRGLEIAMGVLVDPLSATMSVIVSLVAFLVTIYSLGYMKGDPGFSRYFSYLSLFAFSMLGLVVADNYFQTFVFWELVGLSSYLLIGFWYAKPSASDAARKAFVTNRWADFAFMVGVLLLFTFFGTFDFGQLSSAIAGARGSAMLALVAALIFVGPLGKSAQFPFHVWLPDAMEGPTPVSALIHAATMVAAGVYLIARGFVLFQSVSGVMETMAYLGGFTALFAASIAFVQKDIKRILAYSTLSQLGYMFMALGVGSMSAGMFHLTTHAFFKALLFLGAGSVIHATEEQDIFKMGGLGRKMKITAWTFVIGALALSGIFPLAGFWSKDEILFASLSSGHVGLYVLGLAVAFMTAFYMFRLIFTAFGGSAFGGESPEHGHAHESGPAMTIPLIVLAILSVFAGLIGSPWFQSATGFTFGSFIFFGKPEAAHLDLTTASISTVVALAGIFLAWLVYGKKLIKAERIAVALGPLYRLLDHKFYIDEIYGWVFAKIMLGLGIVFDWVDHYIVDGLFDGLGSVTKAAGRKLRLTQSGRLQGYALVIFAAVAIAVVFISTDLLGGFLK
ncbi:MAG TPA: NADH-quinone oxidoreductase subunit L [Rectinemataceae bacterium]|nr:NADH-quinone oxidoreductase subunit L [Rectinemataceae bacterium]